MIADIDVVPSRVGKMASLFLECLLDDLGLEPLRGVHLLDPSVLVLEFVHPRHQRRVHASELAQSGTR